MSDVLGGTLTLAPDLAVTRMGYGAMQLAGPHVFGPPRDRAEAVAVLREAVETGITHLDTSDYYGPHITNEIIREALHPYPDDLVIVTKVGARRDAEGGWPAATSPAELVQAVHDNLSRLGVEAIDVVNYRLPDADRGTASVIEPIGVLAQLQQQGLVRHLGISNATLEQLTEAQAVAPIVCVQNAYNLVTREDDALVDACAAQGVGFTPFFPLGGFTPLQSTVLDDVAGRLGATPLQVALAWLLQRSSTILLIPGTSSRAHLRENVAAASLELPADVVSELDALG